jgi:hypothetical protein
MIPATDWPGLQCAAPAPLARGPAAAAVLPSLTSLPMLGIDFLRTLSDVASYFVPPFITVEALSNQFRILRIAEGC